MICISSPLLRCDYEMHTTTYDDVQRPARACEALFAMSIESTYEATDTMRNIQENKHVDAHNEPSG